MESYRGLKVLVTGADGFIGSHLVEALVTAGASVTALALYNSFDQLGWLDDLPATIRSEIELVRGNICDDSFIRKLSIGKQVVFHLAALISIPYSYDASRSYVDTNIVGTLNVLQAGRENNIERIVHTSTSEVYGTAQYTPINESHPLQGQSPYSASKLGADFIAESFARSFNLPVVILRPFNTYGPRQSERAVISTVIRQILDSSCLEVRVGDVTTKRDFTFVSDTVAAFMAAGINKQLLKGTPYNAGSGRHVSISEMITMVYDITECRKPLITDQTRIRPPQSEVGELLADFRKFHLVTGWGPKILLRDGLSQTVLWWRGRLAENKTRPGLEYMK